MLPQKVDKGPPLELDLVKEFVIAGHGNPERTRELLAQQPGLLNAAWDWGSGDWETAIGGAGHMGRKDIAIFLLSQGARMDIFVAAMMGRLDILRPTLTAFPALASSKGPHGITLMQHAQKGGEEGGAVVTFLESLAAGMK
ncbi:MAG: ankyrin repeat domain-containing protein [Acidobacteria bacterium]|nr:ankyrin repeat domain-containing protein [Acidobacteriota bacterium]